VRRWKHWTARGGGRARLRGYGLGERAPENRVIWGAAEFDQIHRWDATHIELTLPDEIEGRAELRAIRGDTLSNGLTLELMVPRNDAVGAWWIYR